jgi:hypothetical protein
MDSATEPAEHVEQVQDAQEQSETQLSAEASAQRAEVVQMHKELRIWAITSLVIGAASLIAGDTLDPLWGSVMIVIAILAWRVKLPAMFLLFSVLMAWAAVMNGWAALTGTGVWWLVLSALQVYWTFSLVKRWRTFSQLPLRALHERGAWPEDLPPPQEEATTTGRFAIGGLLLAVAALILFPTALGLAVVLVTMRGLSEAPPLLGRLVPAAIDMAVLAFGLSLAALLSENRRRGWAIGGLIASGLALVVWLVFLLV